MDIATLIGIIAGIAAVISGFYGKVANYPV